MLPLAKRKKIRKKKKKIFIRARSRGGVPCLNINWRQTPLTTCKQEATGAKKNGLI
jgi:hypothetical protein